MKDIIYREWLEKESEASKLLKLLIEAEDIFTHLDEYQMDNNQCYPDIEDMMILIREIRKDYTDFIDNHKEILEIKE